MENLKIALIQGSVREQNNGSQVADWMMNYVKDNDKADFELLDLRDFNLPFFGAAMTEEDGANVQKWQETMAGFDGYIFITPEYNRGVGSGMKNAMDFLKPEVANKAAGFVGYGSLGGTRAHDNMRLILAELSMAIVRTPVTFSLMSDFEKMSTFKPHDYHTPNIDAMIDEVITWSTALKTIR